MASETVAGAPEPAPLGVLVEVRGTLRRLVRALERACQEAGLTEPQQHALLCIAAGAGGGEPVTATTLLAHLATDKNTVADVVRRLAAHGLVQRQRQGREVLLTLTPAGRARFLASLATLGRELGSPDIAVAAAALSNQLDHYLAIYRAFAPQGSATGSAADAAGD